MSIEINGIAHIQLTVNDAARGLPFWEGLCHFMGMRTLVRNDDTVYCIGGRTGGRLGEGGPGPATQYGDEGLADEA